MEYAVTIGAVILFAIVFIFVQGHTREAYMKTYNECEYVQMGRSFVRNMPLPKESGNKLSHKKFAGSLNTALKVCNSEDSFCKKLKLESEVLAHLSKYKFDALLQSPSVNSEPRIVALARFCLAHSDYIFSDDRVRLLLNEQNCYRTLSVSEITSLKDAFYYVILERVHYLIQEYKTVEKIRKKAEKYTAHPDACQYSPIYKSLKKNNIFIEYCATLSGHNTVEYTAKLQSREDDRVQKLSQLIYSLNLVKLYDFSKYYTPSEILDKYASFSLATTEEKQNFLTLFKKLSDKENLDEFMYAIRLDKYMNTAMARQGNRRVFSLMQNRICVCARKQDISLLAAALSSSEIMHAYFDIKNNKKRDFDDKNSQTLLQNSKHENTFIPLYKFSTINFGINTSDGRLKLTRNMPKEIAEADICFIHNGISHILHLARGREYEVKLGGTILKGVPDIILGEKSLDITITLPYSEK